MANTATKTTSSTKVGVAIALCGIAAAAAFGVLAFRFNSSNQKAPGVNTPGYTPPGYTIPDTTPGYVVPGYLKIKVPTYKPSTKSIYSK